MPKKKEVHQSGNNLSGIISRLTKAKDNCEVTLEIGDGKTLTAVIARDTAEKLDVKTGMNIIAQFDPMDVIIAAN